MTIERGDTLGPVEPDPERDKETIVETCARLIGWDLAGDEPDRTEVMVIELPGTKTIAEAHELGIAATVSRRNLETMTPAGSFRRRPSRYQ